ncbi:hypothetical protein BV20DRAFT_1056815 [Pilatotrama ljubarskyi]|nr:hypothetical protein BV20DRAFT_1056815 [Pilatotrama ljubarskyi]
MHYYSSLQVAAVPVAALARLSGVTAHRHPAGAGESSAGSPSARHAAEVTPEVGISASFMTSCLCDNPPFWRASISAIKRMCGQDEVDAAEAFRRQSCPSDYGPLHELPSPALIFIGIGVGLLVLICAAAAADRWIGCPPRPGARSAARRGEYILLSEGDDDDADDAGQYQHRHPLRQTPAAAQSVASALPGNGMSLSPPLAHPHPPPPSPAEMALAAPPSDPERSHDTEDDVGVGVGDGPGELKTSVVPSPVEDAAARVDAASAVRAPYVIRTEHIHIFVMRSGY